MTTSTRDRDRGVLLFLAAHFRDPDAEPLMAYEIAQRMGRDGNEVADSLHELSPVQKLVASHVEPDGIQVTGLSEAGRRAAAGPDTP